jgi:hypothetical protein
MQQVIKTDFMPPIDLFPEDFEPKIVPLEDWQKATILIWTSEGAPQGNDPGCSKSTIDDSDCMSGAKCAEWTKPLGVCGPNAGGGGGAGGMSGGGGAAGAGGSSGVGGTAGAGG